MIATATMTGVMTVGTTTGGRIEETINTPAAAETHHVSQAIVGSAFIKNDTLYLLADDLLHIRV
jgi:hypothetical protein